MHFRRDQIGNDDLASGWTHIDFNVNHFGNLRAKLRILLQDSSLRLILFVK